MFMLSRPNWRDMRKPLFAVLVLSLAFVTLAAADTSPTAAAAATGKTIEVPVTMDWRIAQTSVSACTSWGLATWPEKKGATGWELRYHFSPPNPAAAGERSKHLTPPFDDEKFTQFGWSPGKGKHWHGLSYSGAAHFGGAPVSCTEGQAKQKAMISNVRIAITLAPDATIAGIVKAPDGSPLRGVRIRAGGRSARTGADGRYEIDVPEKARMYRVRPSKAGLTFRPARRRVPVQPGRTSRANFKAKGHAVLVRVTRTGCPVAVSSDDGDERKCKPEVKGASVTARRVGGGAKPVSARTGADGSVLLIVEKVGPYRFKVTYKGKTEYRTTRVKPGKVTVLRPISSSWSGGYVR